MDDNFNKVFIGSGLMAEMLLHAAIYQKGESPDGFYIIGRRTERCRELMNKYKIRATVNRDMFISSAKVIVLAVDIDCLDDIPEIAASIRDKIPPNALINSVTPNLKIAEIEKYFPNHPVMRLGINLSAISGAGIGTFFCGSVDSEDTIPVARFIVSTFGEVIEVDSEDEFERVWNLIFATSCGSYLSFNSILNLLINHGVNPEMAEKIVAGVYRGTAETFDKKFNDDILKRAFDYTGVFQAGMKLHQDFGMTQAVNAALNTNENELRENVERVLNAVKNAASEKNAVHYKYWS